MEDKGRRKTFMQGKIFRIKDTENPATIGFEFIKAHPERWEDFNYEESSNYRYGHLFVLGSKP